MAILKYFPCPAIQSKINIDLFFSYRELMDELYTFFIQHVDLCFTATLEIDEDYPLLQSLYRMTATDEDTSNGDRLVVGGIHCVRCIYAMLQRYFSRVVNIFNLLMKEYNEGGKHYKAMFVLLLETAFIQVIVLVHTRKFYEFSWR